MNSPGMMHTTGMIGIQLPTPPTPPAAASQMKTSAEQLVISIKPRTDNHPKLEHDSRWHERKNNFKAQAIVNQTDKVLDPNYSPDTEELIDFFDVHQQFMCFCSMFEDN